MRPTNDGPSATRPDLVRRLVARENLRIFGALYGLTGATLKARCAQALDLVQLNDRLADKPSTFFDGMKRWLNIAATLYTRPPTQAAFRLTPNTPVRSIRWTPLRVWLR